MEAMIDTATLALSAVTSGFALSGVMVAIRGIKGDNSRLYLILIFLIFAGLASLPLIIEFTPKFYVFYLPAMLPLLLVLPPAIYGFVKARTRSDYTGTFRRRDSILPIMGIFTTLGYWLLPETSKATMFIEGELPSGRFPALLAIASFCLILCWSVVSAGYLRKVIKQLTKFRRRLKSLYSNTQTYELRWIDWLIVFLVILWLAAVTSLITDNLGSRSLLSAPVIYLLTALMLLFLIAFISPASLPKPVELTNEENIDANKYARSALTNEHAKRLAKRIDVAMRKDALYLDANLSLVKLSRHIGAVPNLVSQTLNEEIGSTFYDYIAYWRINAAKPLILINEASILEISIDVGFNSRSTFYKAFKRETGMTPKAFRQTDVSSENLN